MPRCDDLGFDAPPVSTPRVIELADAVATELADEWLGISLARDLPRGAFGVQEFAFRNAPTIGEAALRLVRYQCLTNDAIVWHARHTEDCAMLGLSVPGAPGGLGRHLDEFLVAVALRYVRELAGEHLIPQRVEFAHAERPPDDRVLSELLGIPAPVFGTGTNVMAFKPDVWDRAVPTADSALLPIIEEYAQQLMPMGIPHTAGRRGCATISVGSCRAALPPWRRPPSPSA